MGNVLKNAQWRGDKHDKSLWERVFSGLVELKTLRTICDEDEELPAYRTVVSWTVADDMEEFQKGYRNARKAAAELRIDDSFDVAHDTTKDAEVYYHESDEDKKFPLAKIDGFSVQRAKLIIDTNKWFAGKMLPKLYGDKLDITSKGEAIIFKDYSPANRDGNDD